MADVHSKRRRLFLRSGIPINQIVRLMSELQKEEDVQAAIQVSRRHLRSSWEDLYKQVGREVDLTIDGKTLKWPIISFRKALLYLAQISPAYRKLLRDIWQERPCSESQPWSLVLYGDELVPGNILHPDNHRKLFCWYATIKELGSQRIKHEILWIPLAVLRSNLMKGHVGAVSVAAQVLLQETFFNDGLCRQGVCADLEVPGGGLARLFFTLGNIVADADGHRAMWSIRGAAGKLPCPCCLNVVNDDDLPTGSRNLVGMKCTDPSRFRLATDQDWFAKADMVASKKGSMSKTAFNELGTAPGLRYVEHGVLWCLALRALIRPSATFTWDSMHCVLSNGIANTEVDAMLSRLRREGITFDDIQNFFSQNWRFCKVFGKKHRRLHV